MKDYSAEFKKTGDLLTNYSGNDVFSSVGSVLGSQWAPLSTSYAIKKAIKYPGKGILEATGQMRAGFRSQPSAMQVIVYNTQDYFKYHQSNKPRGALPRRIMFKLNDYLKTAIVKIFHDGIYQAAQQ